MKKIILILALFATHQSTAQHYRYRQSSRWLLNSNHVQLNAHSGYDFLQSTNEYLAPVQFGGGLKVEYQFSQSHFIGGDISFSSSRLNKNKIAQVLDASPDNYGNFLEMTDGYYSSIRIGVNYSKIVLFKRGFLKFSIGGGLNGTNKQTHSIELYDNSHGGLTNYTELISKGSSSPSAYTKINCSLGVPIGRNVALLFGPQLFATTPTSTRNEYLEVRNGYLHFAETTNTKSSILSLDFNFGVIFAIDN